MGLFGGLIYVDIFTAPLYAGAVSLLAMLADRLVLLLTKLQEIVKDAHIPKYDSLAYNGRDVYKKPPLVYMRSGQEAVFTGFFDDCMEIRMGKPKNG
jgi:hypothetical protein